MNKNSYVRGNTVLAPTYQPDKNKEYEKLKKAKNQSISAKKEREASSKVKALLSIACIFALGILVVWRYSVIYGMQQNLNKTKSDIVEIGRDNENLKVELVKFCSMAYVEDYAVNKLKMVRPEKETISHINLDKQNFAYNVKVNDKSNKNNLWSKILNLIF